MLFHDIGDPLLLLTAERARQYVDVYVSVPKVRQTLPPSDLIVRLQHMGRSDCLKSVFAIGLVDASNRELPQILAILLGPESRGLDSTDRLDLLYETIRRQEFKRPDRSKLQAIARLAAEGQHRLLRIVVACWLGREKEISQELAFLGGEPYREFVQNAVAHGIGDPVLLFTREQAQDYLALYLGDPVFCKAPLPALCERFLQVGRPDCLSSVLEERLRWMSPADLTQIRKLLLGSYSDVLDPRERLNLLYGILHQAQFQRPDRMELARLAELAGAG